MTKSTHRCILNSMPTLLQNLVNKNTMLSFQVNDTTTFGRVKTKKGSDVIVNSPVGEVNINLKKSNVKLLD